ncbi:hypothetical protein WA158_007651 [Blastocystis sp. Blastoise]
MIAFFLIAICVCMANPSIWPQPVKVTNGKEIFCIDSNKIELKVNLVSEIIQTAYSELFSEIFDHSSLSLNGECIKVIQINVSHNDTQPSLEMDESYSISITKETDPIKITCSTAFGAIYALSTLSQLIRFSFDDSLYIIEDCPITIEDKPRFKHRGLLIDSARHYLPLNFIKSIIDSMRYVKLNVLHWQLIDDQSEPVQSKVFEKWWNAAFSKYERYTLNDIHSIVSYAENRGIRVVPELNIPGHSVSWCTGYPELCPSTTCKTPLSPASASTIPFITKIMQEWGGDQSNSGLFDDEYFHLGGNDVDAVIDWMKQKGYTIKDTYKYMLSEAKKALTIRHHKTIFYDDAYPIIQSSLVNDSVIQMLSSTSKIKEITKEGYNVIISDSDHWHANRIMNVWTKAYDYDFVSLVEAAQSSKILGGEVVIYGDYIDASDFYSTLYPTAAAVAEKLWSPASNATSATVKDRLHLFRFYLHQRGIGASPLTSKNNRDAPDGPGSCIDQ